MKLFQTLFLTLIVTIAVSISASAQEPGRPGGKAPMDREKIESMKIGFITNKLNLSPEEAQKFWPVYNKYADEIKLVREERLARLKDGRDGLENMSDKDVEKLVDSEITSRQQELDIIKKYNSQFKQTLPIKKVAQLYRAEEEFKRELLDRIREKNQEKKEKNRN